MNGVLSITSASAERSFSCLKRVKTYLRNTISQGHLSSLCRISIHKDILPEKEDAGTLHEEVGKRFVEKTKETCFPIQVIVVTGKFCNNPKWKLKWEIYNFPIQTTIGKLVHISLMGIFMHPIICIFTCMGFQKPIND